MTDFDALYMTSLVATVFYIIVSFLRSST